ncbi:MAG: serine hydrolase domain-containing protein [Phycisphaerales bacterium]
MTIGHAYAHTQDVLAEKIEEVIDQAELGRFWGVVEVRVGDTPIVSRGYGFENHSLTKIDPQASLFDVGSISKSITAAAILRLIDEHKLSLSTTISDVFQEHAGNLSDVTIEQLLRHESGLGHAQGLFSNRESFYSIDSFIEAAGQVKLGPKEFAYSNPGYHVLAAVIQRIGGDTFEHTTRNLVFNTAQRSGIGFVGDGQVKDARPTARISSNRYGHSTQGSLFEYPWNWGQRGATGVVMTAHAAADWFEAIESGDWLTEKSRKAMLTPNSSGYGLGLYVDTNEDGAVTRFWHGGSTGGYVCHAARYPLAFDGQGATVILMTQSSINLQPITRKIHKLIQPPKTMPAFAGVYLNKLDEFGDDGIYTINQGLSWKGQPQYIGSDDNGRFVDDRPTLILENRALGMWTLILRMDQDRTEQLIEELSQAINQIAKDPAGGSTPWSRGTTLVINVQDLALTRHNSYLIDEGAQISVQATSDHFVELIITTPDAKHELARVLMGGAEVRQLQAQLKSAMR